MSFRTSFAPWNKALLTALGLSPLTACGGTTIDATGRSAAGSSGTGDAPSMTGGIGGEGGGGPSTGGKSTGGRGSGGVGNGGALPGGFGGFAGFGPGGAAGSVGGSAGIAGFAGSAGAAGAAGGFNVLCLNPTTLRGVNGQDTGFETCGGTALHRPAKVTCQTRLPRPELCQPGCDPDAGFCSTQCTRDADCTAAPNGYCQKPGNSGFGGAPGCYCSYGCAADSDCGPGSVCVCGDPVGYCQVTVDCTTDADCNGTMCLSSDGCSNNQFSCQSDTDTCVTAADCGDPGLECARPIVASSTAHTCVAKVCPIPGRPFIVDGAGRVAKTATRRDWSSALAPSLDGLTREERGVLAKHWTDVALMEHASIAAFARFSLEALSLGAPPELLEAAHAAMADETLHARDAFALASAYAGRAVGPGALDMEAALQSRSLLDIVATTIVEGCIGETVAAVDAAEALAHSTDPAVREALARVTVDEGRHSELAWRFVQWVLKNAEPARRREVAATLIGTVERELAGCGFGEDSVARTDPEVLRAHGVIDASTHRNLRRTVLSEIVLPCARALVSSLPSEIETPDFEVDIPTA